MPVPQKGLAKSESWKSWYPALATWWSASKVSVLPMGSVDVRGVQNAAVAALCSH